MLSVPFENLSVFGKEEIFLSKDWLFDKIIRRHRGGFCFELNTLFSLLLNSFGFKHEKHAGMVFCQKTGRIVPPSHLILTVNISDSTWLSDVSFGDSYIRLFVSAALQILKNNRVGFIEYEEMEMIISSKRKLKSLSITLVAKNWQRKRLPPMLSGPRDTNLLSFRERQKTSMKCYSIIKEAQNRHSPTVAFARWPCHGEE